MNKYLVMFLILLISGGFCTANAEWRLYDDFESGSIDTQKWDVDDSSATISIENGEARFDHKAGYREDSSWLKILDNPQTIAGVRASIRVESCTGDVRGRIGGDVGSIQDNIVFAILQARPERGILGGWVDELSPAQNYAYVRSLGGADFYYNWDKPLNILGNDYVLEMMFSNENITFKTDNGEGVLTYAEALDPLANPFLAIGTRSNTGEGFCTVYFDDVYVYRNASNGLPAINMLLLQENQ